jgi:site-specific recombinase XerD
MDAQHTAVTELATVDAAELATTTGSRNPARVYLASLATGSRTMTAHRLNVIADIAAPGHTLDTLPWAALRYEHTQAIRARLAERYDAATANATLSALRQVLKTAWRLGQMTAEEYMRAADVQNVKGEKPDQAAGRALAFGELMALVGVCADGTPSGARDAAMLAVAYSCGLRRAEIVGLDLVDYAGGVLTVKGKRNKVRTVPIQNGAQQALDAWLELRGDTPGAIFTPVGKAGRITIRRMTPQAVFNAFAERADQAGVQTFSPHDLRRTFAGDLLDAGADISTVQKMMGHANVTTTAGYDRRGERAKKDAAKRLHFPYQGAGRHTPPHHERRGDDERLQ